jgi:hypothetical protein
MDGRVGLRGIQTCSPTANKRARKLNKRESIESTSLPGSLNSRAAEGTSAGGEGMIGAVCGAIGRLDSLKRESMRERMSSITETQAEIETCGEEELYKLPFYVGRSLPYEPGGWAVPLSGACL